ncbi:MAG: elongation factor G [Phycisphaerae bacterium]|nr:elongation factor G [Phycisphaerae bacterium]
MANHTTDQIRNVLFAGTSGAGKTTLVEAMLVHDGIISRAGRVEDGNTVSDWDDLEKSLGFSVDSSVLHLSHAGCHLNVIDTPGRNDFFGKGIACLPAVETMVLVLDPTVGLDPVARRMMKMAIQRNLPRAIVINKIDSGADLSEFLEALQATFGTECRPINLPADGGKSIIRCFKSGDGESDLGSVGDFHTGLVDQVVEVDEELMEQYLEQGGVTPEQLEAPFKRAMREGHLVPVLFTSAKENIGVEELLDQISEFFPNPAEGNARPFQVVTSDGREDITVEADAGKPLVAHVFKVASDPYVGKMSYMRIHQGSINNGDSPRVDDERKGVRVSHFFEVQGKDTAETKTAVPGDIIAVSKVDEINYDSVLHAEEKNQVAIRPIPTPKPMFGLAIEGTSKGAESKIGDALSKMSSEDPTFQVERNVATGELVIRGLGENHLRAKLRLLKDRYGVEVDSKPPKVAYKETITGKAEGHHRHKKQSGGSGQFGEVYLRVEPLVGEENDGVVDGLLFKDDTFGGSVPKQFLPAIEKGVRQVMVGGAVAGYPMQDVVVSVYDGKHHPVDSKEVAFVTAGKRAFIDAVQKANPVLLEPFVKMEITVPQDAIGDISSDLSGRRGRIQGTDVLPGNQVVMHAEAPLSEVMTYAAQLKSITAGAGSYSMEYSHDENTPPNVQAEVVAAFNPVEDED